MKQFEKWWVRWNTKYQWTNEEIAEIAWKAALEWVLADLKAAREGFDLNLYDTLNKELGETEK